MNTQTEDERHLKRLEYRRQYRLTHPDYDLKQRLKPEYRERELARMKNRYRQVKQMKFYESVKDALPHFLTA